MGEHTDDGFAWLCGFCVGESHWQSGELVLTDKLRAALRRVVARAMNEIGATQQYRELVRGSQIFPLVKSETFDIDRYRMTKSLNG